MNRLLPRFRLRTIRSKLLVFTMVPVTLGMILVIGIGVWNLQLHLRAAGEAIVLREVQLAADEINRRNIEALAVPKTMALAQSAGLFGKRAESEDYARRILDSFPAFTGAYFGYEPNADGQDAAYRPPADPRAKLTVDSQGRYLPYWFRAVTNNAVSLLEPLKDMESSFYYLGLKNRFNRVPETAGVKLAVELSKYYREQALSPGLDPFLMVTEPYEYEKKLIVEQTYPIIVTNEFKGVAGVDRALKDIEAFVDTLKPYNTSDFFLVSQRGRIIAATGDASLEAKPFENTPYENQILPFYQMNTHADFKVFEDPVKKESYFYAAAKIPMGHWTLVMRVSEQELMAPVLMTFLQAILLGGVGLTLVLLSLAFMARAVSTRVRHAVELAQRVAAGDLTSEVQSDEPDETGQLLRALQTMVANLNSLIGQVKGSSVQLLSTANEIGATSKQQERAVSGFSASTNQIAAAVKQISATSQELSKTMGEVTTVANETASLADDGRSTLGDMETMMRTLASATNSFSSKLSIINERASKINGVVNTITKVADQTNLLSLNAAIEAEKAGEHGLGFAVVAREIRRLADQTAVATLDIEQMVKEMQSSVSAGVMEMDKFTEEVRRGVDEARKISQQLGRIIEQVEALPPRVDTVSEGMRSQSEGAQQISQSTSQLAEVARQTSASVQEFDLAATHLQDAVRGLRDEISRFKVESTGDTLLLHRSQTQKDDRGSRI